ncbi:MAG: hypothetical protein IPP94_18445 [Ignavibacteria bacterium]|nr:hypothetical protein [Ignavibacteria bacterium]
MRCMNIHAFRNTALCAILLACVLVSTAEGQRRSSRRNAPESWFSMQGGVWYLEKPADVSPETNDATGVAFSFRFGMTRSLAMLVDMSVWHTQHARSSLVQYGAGESYRRYSIDAWSLTAPFEIGLCLGAAPGRSVQPYFSAGGGVAVTISKRTTTRVDIPSDPTSVTRNLFAPCVFAGCGIDFNVSRDFGFTLGAKYRYVPLSETLATEQTVIAGALASGGIRLRL